MPASPLEFSDLVDDIRQRFAPALLNIASTHHFAKCLIRAYARQHNVSMAVQLQTLDSMTLDSLHAHGFTSEAIGVVEHLMYRASKTLDTMEAMPD